MRLLSDSDIEKLISPKEVIQIMKNVFSQIGGSNVVIPERAVIELGDGRGDVLFMPGYIPEDGCIGIKIVSVSPGNRRKGKPTTTALVVLNNVDTGEAVSVMDGTYITALRTAAVSALATDHLAKKDASTLGIFGSGVQARSHIEVLREVRDIRRVKIYGPNRENSRRLAHRMDSLLGRNCEVETVESPNSAVIDSDIIVTATTSKIPVFDGTLLREGTHINSIGSFKPHHREVDDVTIKRAKIFVDSYSSSLSEGGDLMVPLKKGIISERDIKADLGELILGKKKGRETDREITFFKSVGIAVQDIAVAQRVYAKATESNSGMNYRGLFSSKESAEF